MTKEEFEKLCISGQNSVLFDMLQEVLSKLKNVKDPMPYIPSTPFPDVKPYTPIYPSTPYMDNKCGVCGIDFSGPMGYVCNRSDCPTPRITYS